MIYLDTNIIISLLSPDSTTAAAEEWWSSQSAPLGVSSWVAAEFYSHVALRRRKGELTPRQVADYAAKFDELVAANLTMLKASDAAVQRASIWLRAADGALQPPDALHLAIAVENDAAAFATFDHRFAKNIERLRIAGLKVIALPNAGDKLHRIQQRLADYNVTEKDIAKAVRAARKRKAAEKGKAARPGARH